MPCPPITGLDGSMNSTPALKNRLRSELTTAIKNRDELRSSTLRMCLAAITNEEVSGKSARVLTDADVVTVLSREAKKRREAAEAFRQAGRAESVARELAELAVVAEFLPAQLSAAELDEFVAAAIADSGASGPAAMGAVMKLVQPKVAGKADGSAVAAAVRSALAAAQQAT